MLTVIAGGGEYRGREVREKQVVVRVQRRVRMGMKDELGPPYILSSSSDHMTIYLYLFGSLHFLIHLSFSLSGTAQLCRSILECSSNRVKG